MGVSAFRNVRMPRATSFLRSLRTALARGVPVSPEMNFSVSILSYCCQVRALL